MPSWTALDFNEVYPRLQHHQRLNPHFTFKMYNGIGVQTARGTWVLIPSPIPPASSVHPELNLTLPSTLFLTLSGTNGHVVRNLSHLKPRDQSSSSNYGSPKDFNESSHTSMRQPDQGILEHERKRKVEVKCMEERLRLEDEGWVLTVLNSALGVRG